MKATRVLLHFAMVSMAAYVTLSYFGFAYESLLLFAADRFAQILSLGARLAQDASHQLFIIVFLPGGPVQVKLAGIDWIYASQATAAGSVLSTYTSPGRKAFWLTIVCTTLALAHTALLVLAVAEISKQINGANGELAAFGRMAFKLYRITLPALLAATWIICSREALFTTNVVRDLMPVSARQKTMPTLRLQISHLVPGKSLMNGMRNPTTLRETRTERRRSHLIDTPQSILTPPQYKPPPSKAIRVMSRYLLANGT